MVVINLSVCPRRLRGDLTLWLSEVATGVFVGQVSARVRENLWNRVLEHIGDGRAIMAYTTNNEQRYEVLTYRAERTIKDYDGLGLVYLPADSDEEMDSEEVKEGYSNISKHRKIQRITKRRASQNTPEPSIPRTSASEVETEKPEKSEIETGKTEKYVFVDLETTGLHIWKDEIIELAFLVVVKNLSDGTFRKEYQFSQLIRPKIALTKEITELTGIQNHQIQEEGGEIRTALEDLVGYLDQAILVGHNVQFDLKFLRKVCSEQGIPFPKTMVMDTYKMSLRAYGEFQSHTLENLSRELHLEHLPSHRALDDVMCTFDLFVEIQKRLK